MGFFDSLFDPGKNSRKASRAARQDFRDTRAITDPFYQGSIDTGADARGTLADLMGLNGIVAQQTAQQNYQSSPGFDFNFDQGTRAIDNSGAARGMSQSGSQLKALQQFGQGLHNQDFTNHLARLNALTAGGSLGAAGLTGNSQHFGNLKLQDGASRDSAGAAGLGNLTGLLGTAASFATGFPTGGTGGFGGSGGSGGLGQLFGRLF